MHLCVELVLFCVFAGMMSSTLCISRQLNDFERSYSDTKLEALALSGIPHIVCLCTQFVVYTYHKALVNLFSSAVLDNRLWSRFHCLTIILKSCMSLEK